MRLQSIVGPEESFNLQLGPLHRIVLGLSSADLARQIDMDPVRINDIDWLGRTPLMRAASKGDSASVQILLSRGARTDLSCRNGSTPLHMAMFSGDFACMKKLIHYQADKIVNNHSESTPLHALSQNSKLSQSEMDALLSIFRDVGADFDGQDRYGSSSLYLAVHSGSITGIKSLVKHGANLDICNHDGYPVIYYSVAKQSSKCFETLCQVGARLSWEHSQTRGPRNILEAVAFCGGVDQMDFVADSTLPLIEYSAERLDYFFHEGQKHEYLATFGLSTEEKLQAFRNMVLKKGVAMNTGIERIGVNLDSLQPIEEIDKNDHGDNETSGDEDSDTYEDALEEFT